MLTRFVAVLLELKFCLGQFCDMIACGLKEEILHNVVMLALDTVH
jgi:hypothetical protein